MTKQKSDQPKAENFCEPSQRGEHELCDGDCVCEFCQKYLDIPAKQHRVMIYHPTRDTADGPPALPILRNSPQRGRLVSIRGSTYRKDRGVTEILPDHFAQCLGDL